MPSYSRIARAYGLIDACLQVGADPDGWRHTLARGAQDLFDATVVLAGEHRNMYDLDRSMVLHHVDLGWSSEEQKALFIAYQVDGAHADDPARAVLGGRGADFVATSLGAIVDMDAYRQGDVYRRYIGPSGIVDQLIGITRIGGAGSDRHNLFTSMRAAGQPMFTAEDRRLLRILLLTLGPLVGTRLADTTSPVFSLTPRLHQALRLMLEGRSEAAAGEAMGISRTTFHKYVTELYRHFGVSSRAELQAWFAGRGRLTDDKDRAVDPRAGRLRREGAPATRPWRAPGTFRPAGGRRRGEAGDGGGA